jgi:RNA polymerase sigma-70 factor (ECF subfamily)
MEEMKQMVEKGLEKLEPKYREVILLYYGEEMSYQEIADILQVPTGTVGVRIKRAKDALKKAYQAMNLTYER